MTEHYVETVTRSADRELDLDFEAMFSRAAGEKAEYVVGPKVWVDPENQSVNFTFVFKRQAPSRKPARIRTVRKGMLM